MRSFLLPAAISLLILTILSARVHARRLFDPQSVNPLDLSLTNNDDDGKKPQAQVVQIPAQNRDRPAHAAVHALDGAHAGPVIPDDMSAFERNPTTSSDGSPTLPDILGRERTLNIFASLTRSLSAARVETRLADHRRNTTVLAPSNAALQRLERKPWESSEDAAAGEGAYAGASGENRAARNLRQFVEMHVLPYSPWPAGTERRTLGGARVYWEERPDGGIMVSSSLIFR